MKGLTRLKLQAVPRFCVERFVLTIGYFIGNVALQQICVNPWPARFILVLGLMGMAFSYLEDRSIRYIGFASFLFFMLLNNAAFILAVQS